MVRTIIKTRICCVRVWFMGRHIYSYSLGNFPRINISYLVSNMITGSVNTNTSIYFQFHGNGKKLDILGFGNFPIEL